MSNFIANGTNKKQPVPVIFFLPQLAQLQTDIGPMRNDLADQKALLSNFPANEEGTTMGATIFMEKHDHLLPRPSGMNCWDHTCQKANQNLYQVVSFQVPSICSWRLLLLRSVPPNAHPTGFLSLQQQAIICPHHADF